MVKINAIMHKVRLVPYTIEVSEKFDCHVFEPLIFTNSH